LIRRKQNKKAVQVLCSFIIWWISAIYPGAKCIRAAPQLFLRGEQEA
jgi:hypothetical protein